MAKKAPKTITTTEIPEQDVIVYVDSVSDSDVDTVTGPALTLISVTDKTISAIKAKYGALKITSLDDDATYQLAKSGHREMVSLRNKVDKKRKELNRRFTDQVNKEAERIVIELAPIETHLKSEVERVDKERKEREQAEFIRKRAILEDAGFKFDGRAYVCGPQLIFADDIAKLTDEQVSACCTEAIAYLEEERKAEEQRKAEEERKAAELAKIAQENAQKDAEIAALKAKLAALEKEVVPVSKFTTPAIQVGGSDGPQPTQPEEFKRIPATASPQPQQATQPAATQSTTAKSNWNAQAESFLSGAEQATDHLNHHEVEATEDDRPAAMTYDFDAGYKCFRMQVLEAFRSDAKLTRAQWIATFEAMEPHVNINTTISHVTAG